MTALAAVTLALGLSASLPAQEKPCSNIPAPEQGAVNPFPGCTVVDDNLVANCGFETGAFTPEWTLSGEDIFFVHHYAHSGNFAMYMYSDGTGGCLSQTLTTVPGQSYDLSYWASTGPDDGGSLNEVRVRWNDAQIDSWYAVYFHPYFQRRVGGLIGTGADTLTFRHDTGGYRGWYSLDDIVVIPSPAIPR